MKSLITGSEGFIGKWLTQFLQKEKDTVISYSRSQGKNITNRKQFQDCLLKNEPNRIFHLAAQSNISDSFTHPKKTFTTNIIGSLNIFESIRTYSQSTPILSVGSSAEYGAVKKQQISEHTPLSPSSPYALSKVTQYHLATIYKQKYGLKIVHVRPFAIIGPGKEKDAMSDFAKGIVRIERGISKVLEVGTIDNIRDFMDIRDAVQAFTLASMSSSYDVINICTGKGISLKQIIEIFSSMAKKKITVQRNDSKKRSVDDSRLVGDPTRLLSIGFKPQYSLHETLEYILNYWRNEMKN